MTNHPEFRSLEPQVSEQVLTDGFMGFTLSPVDLVSPSVRRRVKGQRRADLTAQVWREIPRHMPCQLLWARPSHRVKNRPTTGNHHSSNWRPPRNWDLLWLFKTSGCAVKVNL